MVADLKVLEIGPDDNSLLQGFLKHVYEPAFPDPDERESGENIREYLRRKRAGWYGRNDYHVLVVTAADTVVGGAILDYLAIPNATVIEFIVVAPTVRARRVGSALFEEIRRLTRDDAARAGATDSPWIMGETEDPYLAPPSSSPDDPFQRLAILQGWGAKRLCFPYIQPALDPGKRAVRHLHLVGVPLDADESPSSEGMAAWRVRAMLREYMRWAMRIERPSRNGSYREMAAALRGLERVPLEPLDRLTLSHRAAQFVEPEDPENPRIAQALRIYDAAIGATDQKVPVAQFLASVQAWVAAGRPSGEDWSYHFAIVLTDAQPRRVIGMLSAFGLGDFAFIGYVALAPEARGHGLGRDLVRWAERRVVEALRHRGGVYRGVFSEVERNRGGVPTPQFRFVDSIGFRQVPVDYRQPSLGPETETGGTPLALVFRPPGTGRVRMPGKRALRDFLERLGIVVFEMGDREARQFAGRICVQEEPRVSRERT